VLPSESRVDGPALVFDPMADTPRSIFDDVNPLDTMVFVNVNVLDVTQSYIYISLHARKMEQ
jgi:hypothetical protein